MKFLFPRPLPPIWFPRPLLEIVFVAPESRSSRFPISRCVDSTEDLGDSRRLLSTISLDAWSGYHQIRVRENDQEKLAIFTPSGTKKTF